MSANDLDAYQDAAARTINPALGDLVAAQAKATAEGVLGGAPISVDVVVIDRAGMIVGRA